MTRGPSGSAGQQTGGSGGGTTTDLMVRSLEKVMQQLQGMSSQFGELRLTNERQQRQLDDLLTGFRGLEQRVNVNQGVGGQGREAQGASPSRPQGREAQGASPGVPAWGSPNLPDPWGAASEAARQQGVGFTTYSDPTGQRGPYEEGFGPTTYSGPSGQSGPSRVFRDHQRVWTHHREFHHRRDHLPKEREPIGVTIGPVAKEVLGRTGIPGMGTKVEVGVLRMRRMRTSFKGRRDGCQVHRLPITVLGRLGCRRLRVFSSTPTGWWHGLV